MASSPTSRNATLENSDLLILKSQNSSRLKTLTLERNREHNKSGANLSHFRAELVGRLLFMGTAHTNGGDYTPSNASGQTESPLIRESSARKETIKASLWAAVLSSAVVVEHGNALFAIYPQCKEQKNGRAETRPPTELN